MTQDDLPKPSSGETVAREEGPSIVQDENDFAYSRILVPIDFSEHSKKTVSYATRIATRYNSTIYLLHVFQIPDYVVTPYAHRKQASAEVQSHVDEAEQDARENLEAFAQELSKSGITVQPYLRVGYPFDEIVLMAKHFDVDLIIIGSHGRGAISRLLVGSTAERVVEHALCPVLVVKEPRPGGRSE
ncbi:MAG: universal stress protein [Verrucomicrobia bacterium]|nr:universal stress protein [Verrucomicrobiota bacterium]MBV9128939.1 universal stress protein [Verrucomicrobiota bacterium]MBV9643391.1 universal stress protein [Verrucomicrobiota bacterium]